MNSVLLATGCPADNERIQRVYNLRTDQLVSLLRMSYHRSLPISLKKCSWFLRANNAAAML
jgi:hypothetical protein